MMLYGKLKPINIVLAQISLVEQRLRTHRSLVSQLSQSRDHATHQGKDFACGGAQPFVPTQRAFGPEPVADDESPRYQDSPIIPAPIHHASNAGSAQPVNEDPIDHTVSEDAIVGNSTQRDDLWSVNVARPEVRLHTADFIQSLSE